MFKTKYYIIGLFGLFLLFFMAPITKAEWGVDACLPHFEGNPDAQAKIRACEETAGGSAGGSCSLKCWNSNNHWWYHCYPNGAPRSGQSNSCPADFPIPGWENKGDIPPGAWNGGGVKTIVCQGCNNWINCWPTAPSPTTQPRCGDSCPTTGSCPTNCTCNPTTNKCEGQTPTPTHTPQCGDTCPTTGSCPTNCSCNTATNKCEVPTPPPSCGNTCPTTGSCPNNCPCNTSNNKCEVPPPSCGQACPAPGSGLSCPTNCPCNTGTNTCTAPTATPAPQCGQACPTTGQCPSNCPCDTTTHQCTTPATPTPTTGACYIGKTCSNCGGNPGNCKPDCNGGWCNGGQCASCEYVPSGPSHCVKGNSCSCKSGESCVVKFDEGPDGICTRQSRGVYEITSCGVSPTPTVTPTPTGIQPTQEVTMIPTPTVNPTVAQPSGAPVGGTPNPVTKVSQRWVCLKALPCSDSASGCSAILDHRVKLSVKTDRGDDAKPIPNQPTYVFECIQTPTGHKCTTGDPAKDQEILGSTNYPLLAAAPPQGYGYSYGGMYFADGSTVAPNPVPVEYNNNGDIGTYEWESYTQNNVPRLFLAMNKYTSNSVGGDIGAQQQGILPFLQSGSKKCIQISWDPNGTVYDHLTLQPVAGATVTLLMKGEDGQYKIVTGNDFLSGIENPIMTDTNGNYNFMVPDGIYKIEVKKDGYASYKSSDIKQAGKPAQHDVDLKKEGSTTFMDSLQEFFKSLLP